DQVAYQPGDVFLFGPETRGLPDSVLSQIPAQQQLFLPMQAHSRSLNLANTVSVAVYEAWRQHDFIRGGHA
ncbi:MAG TPA: tRNA (uridine(34)/cytosine(34)/5-carboxymethylaminomethyluridine(34)-2'-O)-methyltransferase TrmL, partial [Halothiobacillaceae bacterium]|nr:tRNA (uridine(34)/cytosine(34)/5-carboxymethylaminomethyluridine(34)-2'-O)-methyltransferase TrmL [Halothiobacillaceae bacterium]